MNFCHFPGMIITVDLKVTSDAAGAIGFRAYWGSEWFNGSWSQDHIPLSIAYEELFPIVISTHLWGSHWSTQNVLFISDNEAVVNILDARSSKDPGIMHLLCSLLLASEHFNFIFSSSHVPGLQNKIADALSYFNQQAFRRLAPHTHQHPVHIPADLLEALSNPH